MTPRFALTSYSVMKKEWRDLKWVDYWLLGGGRRSEASLWRMNVKGFETGEYFLFSYSFEFRFLSACFDYSVMPLLILHIHIFVFFRFTFCFFYNINIYYFCCCCGCYYNYYYYCYYYNFFYYYDYYPSTTTILTITNITTLFLLSPAQQSLLMLLLLLLQFLPLLCSCIFSHVNKAIGRLDPFQTSLWILRHFETRDVIHISDSFTTKRKQNKVKEKVRGERQRITVTFIIFFFF